MNAGALRIWLRFEKLAVEIDSDGAQVESWVNAFTVSPSMPCELVSLSGRELIAAQAVQSKVTARINVRYREGFSATMRAVSPLGALYNIEAVIPDPKSTIRSVTLLASTGASDGK